MSFREDIMEDKKIFIMAEAGKLFKKKGLKNTSIEDIAKECKISKSTFYKYFSTKEDLIAEKWVHTNERILEEFQEAQEDTALSSKEKFKKHIEIMCSYIAANSGYNNYVLEKFPEAKGDLAIEIKKKARKDLLLQSRKALLNLYGEKAEGIIWELIFLLDSIIHEFNFITRVGNQEFSKEFISEYVSSRMDIFIEIIEKAPAMIDEFTLFDKEEMSAKDLDRIEFNKKLKKLKEILKYTKLTNTKSKVLKALDIIEEEGKKGEYHSLMMDGMISFLEKEEGMKKEIEELDLLRRKVGGI